MDIFEAEVARRFVVAVEKIANALDRKTEPTISKMEQVEDEPQTEDLQDWKDRMWAEAVEASKTEPQTERSE